MGKNKKKRKSSENFFFQFFRINSEVFKKRFIKLAKKLYNKNITYNRFFSRQLIK
jgi:hypothetical protein